MKRTKVGSKFYLGFFKTPWHLGKVFKTSTIFLNRGYYNPNY